MKKHSPRRADNCGIRRVEAMTCIPGNFNQSDILGDIFSRFSNASLNPEAASLLEAAGEFLEAAGNFLGEL